MALTWRGKQVIKRLRLPDEKKIEYGSGAVEYWGSSFQVLRGPNPPTGFWKDFPSEAYSDPSKATIFYDDFHKIDVESGRPWMLDQASGYATVDNIETSGCVAGGVIKIGVGAQSGDYAWLKGTYGDLGGAFSLNSGKPIWFECRVDPVASASQNWAVGLLDPVTTTVLDSNGTMTAASGVGIFFRGLKTSATLISFCVAASGVATVAQASIGTVASGGFKSLRFKYDGNDSIIPYVDDTTGTIVLLSAGKVTQGVPLAPVVGLNTQAALAKHLWVDWIKVGMIR